MVLDLYGAMDVDDVFVFISIIYCYLFVCLLAYLLLFSVYFSSFRSICFHDFKYSLLFFAARL